MNTREIKNGAILSYLLIIINTFYGLFFTPFLITSLGEGEYGVYRIVGSLIGSLTILDLGIGSTILRYTAQFYAKKQRDALGNFAAMGLLEAFCLSVVMAVICVFAYSRIDNIYSGSLSASELAKAQELFVLFSVILILNTFEKVLFSIIAGCEHYTFANSLKLGRIVLKLVLSVLILRRIADSAVLLIIDIAVLLAVMFIQFHHINKRIRIRIHLIRWDNSLFAGSFRYTILMFIQSIVVQFNGNLDNMVIGAVIGSTAVTVYSIGLQLYNMYEQFAISFSDLMLPTVSKQIASGANTTQLEDTVIKVGRLEFIALGGALCGFVIIGREFIHLWLGEGYSMAWTVGLILMIPTTIPLIQNVCLSILRAKNKMLYRTIVVSVMAVFNFAFTLIGVPIYGPVAACIGTALGLVGANIIAMNIYYVKVIHLNVIRIFRNVLSRTWLCCVVASICLLIADNYLSGSWMCWMLKVCVFLVAYQFMLLIYGMTDYEKNYFIGAFRKVLRRK